MLGSEAAKRPNAPPPSETFGRTPLLRLGKLSGVAGVYLKDESQRSELGTFKSLGGAHAIGRLLLDGRLKPGDTVCCATDGNHGRGVALAAGRGGLRCEVYIPHHVSLSREESLWALGASVTRLQGTYEAALEACTRAAKERSWTLISDTATPDDTEIPRIIMDSYGIIAEEIFADVGRTVTHLFAPVGVGGLAASLCERLFRLCGKDMPRLITVEPDQAACMFESIRRGELRQAQGTLETLIGCLACARPATLAWDVLRQSAFASVTVSDQAAAATMVDLANASFSQSSIEGGESGVASLAGLVSALASPSVQSALEISRTSVLLAILTEGPSDRLVFERLVGRPPSE